MGRKDRAEAEGFYWKKRWRKDRAEHDWDVTGI